MLIRAELPGDVEDIASVTGDAFGRTDGEEAPEVGLVAALRASESWIRQLSLVAVLDDTIVGHCLSTRGMVGDDPVLALGPLSVAVAHQRGGIGSTLVRSTIDIATEMSESLIGLLGDPAYYERFGFVPGSADGVDPPESSWGRHFQIRRLPGRLRPVGVFRYPAPFAAVS